MSVRSITAALRECVRVPSDRRLADLSARLDRSPRCAVTRYLLACHCFDRDRPASAVRHMMVAHHCEPEFESAALLVFAGLSLVTREGTPLLRVLLDTWEEFRRPMFDRYPRERVLLDGVAEELPGLSQASRLAQRLWRLPIQTLRAQIRQAVASADVRGYPLLMAPA